MTEPKPEHPIVPRQDVERPPHGEDAHDDVARATGEMPPPPEKPGVPPPPMKPEMPPTPRPKPEEETPKPEGPRAPPPPPAPEIVPQPDRPEIPPPRSRSASFFAERPEAAIEAPRHALAARSRRDFLLLGIGAATTAIGAWWLLPDRAKGRLLGEPRRDRLDTLAARIGLSRENREKVLDRTLTFDDDVAEAFDSRNRRVRAYDRSAVTPLRNNYQGQTPRPEHLVGWRLGITGLASGRDQSLTLDRLLARFRFHEQVTRLVCVEGWSAIAWWGGIHFADLLDAFPPAPAARWAALRSSVSLDGAGRNEPYYVSIDLDTARHPQTLLATHQGGAPLSLAHGAPLRLLVPVKLGLKNIKALTDVAYTRDEPADYWNERGYSRYDGL